jgi:hypothetical protein
LLGLYTDDGCIELRKECIYTLILFSVGTCRVEESDDDVSRVEGAICLRIDALMDIVDLLASILLSTSTMDSWCIEEYYLYSFLLIGIYPWDTPLGRLGTM